MHKFGLGLRVTVFLAFLTTQSFAVWPFDAWKKSCALKLEATALIPEVEKKLDEIQRLLTSNPKTKVNEQAVWALLNGLATNDGLVATAEGFTAILNAQSTRAIELALITALDKKKRAQVVVTYWFRIDWDDSIEPLFQSRPRPNYTMNPNGDNYDPREYPVVTFLIGYGKGVAQNLVSAKQHVASENAQNRSYFLGAESNSNR